MPAGPKNFRSCGGNLLSPLLLVALYFCSKIIANSSCVMWWVCGLVRGA